MYHPITLRPIRNTLVALLLCAFFSVMCHSQPTPLKTGLLIVTRASNMHQYIGSGIVYKFSPNWAWVTDGYVGGATAAVQSQALVLFKLSPTLTMFAAAGPEMDVVQTAPTQEQKLSYLQAASTIGLSIKQSDALSFWLAFDRLDGNAPGAQYKIAVGAVFWSLK